jgi:Family of unknown function (DUF6262)
MPADHAALVEAARRRHELTRAKAIQALRELDRAGTPINFEVVARTARVSRSWLYAQADLRADIQRLRAVTRRTRSAPVPSNQHPSQASVQTRLHAALDRNQVLAEDNQRLRRQLAQVLGAQRSAETRDVGHPKPEPVRKSRASITIGPCH